MTFTINPTMIMLCGLPGSGKSTLADQLTKNTNITIFSSDKIREELAGTSTTKEVNTPAFNAIVFQELHKRIKTELLNGNDVIYDATNISSKKRIAFLNELKDIPCAKECIIVARQYENCLKANAEREHPIPDYVITRMYKNWNTPHWFEGWDSVQVYYPDHDKGALGMSIDIALQYKDFDQCNRHHTLTLGEHIYRTWELAADEALDAEPFLTHSDMCSGWYNCVAEAALLHDIGKPFTKTFTNMKNEVTEDAHYYNHQNVGAYDALFVDTGYRDGIIAISTLINLHMYPYFWAKMEPEQCAKMHEKYKKLWGNQVYDTVMLLYHADREAH